MRAIRTSSFVGMLLALVACDPNAKAIYGEETGLPKNCRAYVQASVDGYKEKKYTADEVMAGLERNCGAHGHLWGK